jgi:hypothetical protein
MHVFFKRDPIPGTLAVRNFFEVKRGRQRAFDQIVCTKGLKIAADGLSPSSLVLGK